MSEIERPNAQDAKKLFDNEGYVLLDVRSVPEYLEGHPPGAFNVPFLNKTEQGMTSNADFSKVVQDLIADKSKGIVTFCRSGGRSIRAAQELSNLGFSKVVDMRGGFEGEMGADGAVTFPGWKSSGLPVESTEDPERSYQAICAKVMPPAGSGPEAGPESAAAIPSGERWAHPERRVLCVKLKQELPALRRKPMGGPMGIKLRKEVSAPAWEMWVEHSKMIINEYRLNPADPKAQEMLIKQCDEFFFGDGGEKPPEFVQQGAPNPSE
jgi:rhodanese-related sulfurtransferase/Fe-S cluster biosynthesis and repair protein YggX